MNPNQPNHHLDTETLETRSSKTSTITDSQTELIMPRIKEQPPRRCSSDIRKRKKINQHSPEAPSTDTRSRMSQFEKAPAAQDTLLEAHENVGSLLKIIPRHTFDVIGGALLVLKTPMSYLLAVYALFGILVITQNLLTSSIYSALSPICRIPGSSLLNLPMCKSPLAVSLEGKETPSVQFGQLMSVLSNFEDILKDTTESVSLPFEMRRGRASIRDLRSLVLDSEVPSKSELIHAFDGFVRTADVASDDLQRFIVQVGSAVDQIVTMTRWTSRALKDIAERDSNRSLITTFISHKILAPFQPLRFTEDDVLEEYMQHAAYTGDKIQRLVKTAQSLLQMLQDLEEELQRVRDISQRGDRIARQSKDQVLAQLWTKLGGNRLTIHKFESELKVLQQVNTHQQAAFNYLTVTILTLNAMRNELEELGKGPEESRLMTHKPSVSLRLHIDAMELGLERLQFGRKKSRDVQNKFLRSMIDDPEPVKKPRVVDIILG